MGAHHSDSSEIDSDQQVCDRGNTAVFPDVPTSASGRVKNNVLGRVSGEQYPMQNSEDTSSVSILDRRILVRLMAVGS